MWHVRKFFRQYLALQLSIGLGWTLPPPPQKKNDVSEYQFSTCIFIIIFISVFIQGHNGFRAYSRR